MDKKRIIFASGFLLLTAVFGFLIYKVFFAKEKITIKKKVTPTEQVGGQFPTAQEGGLTPTIVTPGAGLPQAGTVSPGAAITPAGGPGLAKVKKELDAELSGLKVGTNGETNFYNQTDGKFYHRTPTGDITPLSDQTFYGVDKVTWSPTSNESVIEYPDGSNILYNFTTKKQISLPKHWEEFSFSPQGEQIAAKSVGLSPENNWLIVSDPTGKNIKLVEAMGENAKKVSVAWSPNNQVIALSRTGQVLGDDRQEILFVGQNKENFRSTIVEGRGFESQWSPDGQQLLYSVFSARSNYKPELWIVNAEGDNIGTGRKLLNINTWSNKCTFGNDRFIYCAVPAELEVGSGFAPALAKTTLDQLWKIDIKTGLKSQIAVEGSHTVEQLFIDKVNEKLLFTDANLTGLYSVDL